MNKIHRYKAQSLEKFHFDPTLLLGVSGHKKEKNGICNLDSNNKSIVCMHPQFWFCWLGPLAFGIEPWGSIQTRGLQPFFTQGPECRFLEARRARNITGGMETPKKWKVRGPLEIFLNFSTLMCLDGFGQTWKVWNFWKINKKKLKV